VHQLIEEIGEAKHLEEEKPSVMNQGKNSCISKIPRQSHALNGGALNGIIAFAGK